jgi:hypothetical protein
MGVKLRTSVSSHDTIRPVIEKFCLQISGNYLRIQGVYDRGQARMGFRRRQAATRYALKNQPSAHKKPEMESRV